MMANARTTDPDTSQASAPDTRHRRTQKQRLLAAFKKRPKSGLTSEQAADMAGLLIPGICYWKRVSELSQAGLIRPLMHNGRVVTRKSAMGAAQRVFVIADGAA